MRSIGLVEKRRLKRLPAEVWFRHEYCYFLHDQTVWLLKQFESSGSNKFSISLAENDELQTLLASGVHFIDALRRTGRRSDEERALINAFWPAIISDALLHIYEALGCFERRKHVVAINLLRKPFLENLTYVCWATADRDGFLNALRSGDPTNLSQSTVGRLRKRLFEECGQKVAGKDSDFGMHVFNLLYDLKNPLHGLFQQAVHLITTYKPEFATSPENFNFIFYDASKDELLNKVYRQLPYIMAFFALTAFELLNSFKKLDASALEAFRIQTLLGLAMANDYEGQETKNLYRELSSILGHFECPVCSAKVLRSKKAIAKFLFVNLVQCSKCRSETTVALSGLLNMARNAG